MTSCLLFENLYWCCDQQLSSRHINFQASKQNSPGRGEKKLTKRRSRSVWQASSLKSTSNKYYHAPVLLAKFRMTPHAGVKSALFRHALSKQCMYIHTYICTYIVRRRISFARRDGSRRETTTGVYKNMHQRLKVLTRESRKCCWRSCNFARCGEKKTEKKKEGKKEEREKRYEDPNSRRGSQLYACAF